MHSVVMNRGIFSCDLLHTYVAYCSYVLAYDNIQGSGSYINACMPGAG